MESRGVAGWVRALGLFPSGLYAMTSAFGGERSAVLVSWAQQCGYEPPMLAVASPKGRPIAPLIRDSRAFGLCVVRPDDCFLMRTLSREDQDPYEALDPIRCETLTTGAPLITRAIAALECEVVRHIDLEGDHEMYIGQIVGGRVYDESSCAAAHLPVADGACADTNGSAPVHTNGVMPVDLRSA